MDRRRSSSSSLSSPQGSSDEEEEFGRSSSGEEEEEEEGIGITSGASWDSGPISLGVEEDDEDDEDEEDDDGDSGFPSVHRSPPPAITWPPPVADNSNRPDATGMKKKKPGIIYLSSIPQGFNVSRTTGFFSQYGRVGRVFLQPDTKDSKVKGGKMKAQQEKITVPRNYTEGWIEFMSKRLAKEVATNLNLTQVGGKKRSKAHDIIWNIKYLPGFKWTHLSERLAYEKAVHQQRMRSEISQAKKESDYFKANVEKSRRLKRKGSKCSSPPPAKKRAYEFRQKETDDVIRSRKRNASEGSPEASSSARKRKFGAASVSDLEAGQLMRKRRHSGGHKRSPEKPKKGSKTLKKKDVKKSKKVEKDMKKTKAKNSPKKSDRAELLKALI